MRRIAIVPIKRITKAVYKECITCCAAEVRKSVDGKSGLVLADSIPEELKDLEWLTEKQMYKKLLNDKNWSPDDGIKND